MSFLKGRFLIGLFIIFVGIALLLNNFGITNLDIGMLIEIYWPLILIVFGLKMILNREGTGELITGLILSFLGLSFLGRNTGLFYIDISLLWKILWPSILIVIGFSFLTNRKGSGKSQMAILGGIEKNKSPWQLENSSFIAFMGGIELDLTIAEFVDDTITLDLSAIFGGIDITVPKDVEIHCSGTAILGGLELLDKSTGGIISSTKASQVGNSISNKKLYIYCRAIAGGIEVKSL